MKFVYKASIIGKARTFFTSAVGKDLTFISIYPFHFCIKVNHIFMKIRQKKKDGTRIKNDWRRMILYTGIERMVKFSYQKIHIVKPKSTLVPGKGTVNTIFQKKSLFAPPPASFFTKDRDVTYDILTSCSSSLLLNNDFFIFFSNLRRS